MRRPRRTRLSRLKDSERAEAVSDLLKKSTAYMRRYYRAWLAIGVSWLKLIGYGVMVPTISILTLLLFYQTVFNSDLPIAGPLPLTFGDKVMFVLDQMAKGSLFDILESLDATWSKPRLVSGLEPFTFALLLYRVLLSIFAPAAAIFAFALVRAFRIRGRKISLPRQPAVDHLMKHINGTDGISKDEKREILDAVMLAQTENDHQIFGSNRHPEGPNVPSRDSGIAGESII